MKSYLFLLVFFAQIALGQNVGIGLTPSHKFHVGNGTTRIEGPASTGGMALSVGGFGSISIDKPGIVGGRLTLLENGNLGLGASNPQASIMVISDVNPQLHLRQSNTADYARVRLQGGTAGFWDVAAYNNTTLGNERLNFFNSRGGDIISIAGNGNVGIGTTNPISPLSFPATLGRKITLYPGGGGVVGMGVYNNEFRIHTDYAPADITMGFEDNAGAFTERFRFKGNGAFAVNGNTGSSGQVLSSNGPGASPSWANPKVPAVYFANQTANTDALGALEKEIAGLTVNFTLSQTSSVVFTGNLNIVSTNATFTSFGYTEIKISDGINQLATARCTGAMDPLRKSTLNPVGAVVLGPGFYTAKAYFGRLNTADLPATSFVEVPSQLIVQVYPQ